MGWPSTSELSEPREQLGVGHLCWVDVWWISWLKRQTHLLLPGMESLTPWLSATLGAALAALVDGSHSLWLTGH